MRYPVSKGMATQAIDTDELRSSDETPYTRELMGDVSAHLNRLGFDNAIVEVCTVAPDSGLIQGAGRTPAFVVGGYNPVKDLIFSTGLPFDLSELAEEAYEDVHTGEGKAHVTTFVNYLELAVEDVINHLYESGQLNHAATLISSVSGDETNDNDILAYAIWTYAKGWIAEKLISEMDKYAKLWVTNDQAGQDVRDIVENVEKQVKCVTFKKQIENHVYYQWDMNGRLIVGTKYLEVAGKAVKNSNVSKTLSYRCHSEYKDDNGDTYRYIWW